MNKLSLITLMILIGLVGSKAQVPQHMADSLQNVLNLYQGGNTIPGISAAVYIHNIGTWTGTSGDSHGNAPLSSNMLMGIGSNTKTFTAALMLKLVERGTVSLNDPLHIWLPAFNNIDSTVTIKQLLRHNSGIADYWTTNYVNAIFANPDSVWTNEDVLNFVGPPLFLPGASVSYSNTNFLLSGMIIETATGQEYHTLIRDSIITPLNLTNTFLEGFETVNGVSAHPWHLGQDVHQVSRTAVTTGAFSAGCIKSTPEDMVSWYDHLFNQNFLSANSFSQLTDFITVSGSSINGVGCGLFRMYYDSKTYYLHTGNIRGYASFTMCDAQNKHSISILRNDTFVNCENVAKALARALNVLLTSVQENGISQDPKQFYLYQNYPNPFNPSTTIKYTLFKETKVMLEVFNMRGQIIKTLVSENQSAGIKSIEWDGTDNTNKAVSSGIYIYGLKTGDNNLMNQNRKMLFLK